MNFNTDIFTQFHQKWALLAAGTVSRHNAMTISWGGMGTLWGKPVVTVYVKPCRYTYEFMNDNEYFTISFYPEEYRKSLSVMGSLSGKECDKDQESGLTAVSFQQGITYKEAETTILCKKIYFQDLLKENMPEEIVKLDYQSELPHRMFIGEVIAIDDTRK